MINLGILILSATGTFSLSVLAQVDSSEQILMQGLNIAQTILEWVVLISLIISTFSTLWFVVNRHFSRMEVVLTGLKSSVGLGSLVGCTAFIVENWTPLLIFDVIFVIVQSIFFLIAATTFSKINEES